MLRWMPCFSNHPNLINYLFLTILTILTFYGTTITSPRFKRMLPRMLSPEDTAS